MTTPVGSIRLDLTIDGSGIWADINRQVQPVLDRVLADTQRRLDAIERQQRQAARATEDSATRQVGAQQRQRASVDGLANATRSLENAQRELTAATDLYGRQSPQAESAYRRLTSAQRTHSDELVRAAARSRTSTDLQIADYRRLARAAEEAAARQAAAANAAGIGGSGGGGSRGGRGGGGSSGGGWSDFREKAGSGIKLNAGMFGMSQLPAATTAVVNLVGAVQQLGQVGLLMPGIMAGIGSSVGTAVVGFKGMGEAVKSLSEALASGDIKDIEKAQKAMDGLAPSAQAVAKTVATNVIPAFQKLKKDVIQQNMFEGLDTSITDLSSKAMPHLEKGLGGISKAWNTTFKQLTTSVGSDQSMSFLDKILGNTGEAQTRLAKAIDPMISGLGRLASKGTDFLPRMADGVTALATKFDNWISKSVANGNMDKWINQGIDAAKNLGTTFLNIGKIITGITKSASGDGGLLKWLRDGTTQLAEFINGAEGQGKLAAFFKEGKEQLQEWLPVVKNLAKVLGNLFSDDDGAMQWADGLVPVMNTISETLAKIPGLVQGVATAFLAWKSIQGLAALNATLAASTASLAAMPLAAQKAVTGVRSALIKLTSTRALLGAAAIAGGASAAGSEDGMSQLFGVLGGIGGGALAGSMFGPAGAVIGAGIGGGISALTLILGQNERAARDAATAAAAYADALKKIDDAAQALSGSQKAMNDALADSKGVADASVNDAVASQLTELPGLRGGKNADNVKGIQAALDSLGGTTHQLAAQITGSGPAFDGMIARLRNLGTVGGTMAADALTTLHDQFVGVQQDAVAAAPAVQKLADALTNGDLKQAQFNLHSAFDAVPKGQPLDLLADSTKSVVEQLNAMNVQIDLANTKTLSLKGPLTDETKAALAAAGFAADLAPGTGEILVNPLDKPQPVQKLYDLAPSATVNNLGNFPVINPNGQTPAGGGLGDLLGDLPESVDIPVTTPGAADSGKDVGNLGQALKSLPGSKTVNVTVGLGNAMSALGELRANLAALGNVQIPVGNGAFRPATGGGGGGGWFGPGHASGGINAVLPGYSPGVDNMLVPLSGGEGILIPEAVRALGPNFVYGINSFYRPGLGRGYDQGGVVGMPPGLSPIGTDFATVIEPMLGLLGEIRDLLKMNPGSFGGGSSYGGSGGSTAVFAGSSGPKVMPVGGSGLQAAIALAQKANGGKYQLGATGGADGTVFDCSGFMSEIFAAITGKPYSGNERYFTTTSDFPSLGFKEGYDPNSAFNIGVSPEHMAGTLAGVNVESGGNGVQFGGTAHGATDKQFSKQYHLPIDMPAGLAGSGAYLGGSPATAKALRDAQQRVEDRKYDVDKAKDNLDQANGDPKKTARQRQDAQHRYDKSLRELADAQSDMAGKMRQGAAAGGAGGMGGAVDPKMFPYGDPRRVMAGVLQGIGVTPEDIGAIMGSAGGPVGDIASGITSSMLGTPIPGTLGTPVDPATDLNSLVAERNPLALAQAAGVDVPDYSRFGGGASAQSLLTNTGPAGDASGRMYSDTAALVDRTFTNLDAAERARHDQVMSVLNAVKDRLGIDLLAPVVKDGVSNGMAGLADGTSAAIGTAMGTAAADPIAAAVAGAIPSGGGDAGVATPVVAAAANIANPPAVNSGGFHSFDFAAGSSFAPLPFGAGPLGNLYDTGGLWPSGTFGTNLSGAPERVLSPSETRLFDEGKLGGWNLQPLQQHMATKAGIDATDSVGGDFFGMSDVPVFGAIVNMLVMVLLRVIGVQIEARDTLDEISGQFREFRGEFQAFDASGRLMNDTSGLMDRTGSSEQESANERIRILKLVLEGLIKFIIEKVIVPIGKAVANAAINIGSQMASGAITGGLGALPGGSVVGGAIGSVVSGAISAGGNAAVDIIADVGSKLGTAALSVLVEGVSEFFQGAFPDLTQFLFSGDFIAGIADTVTSTLSGMMGGLTAVFGGLFGGLADLMPFDSGGLAVGTGMMPKATITPERVLSPRQTSLFEEMVRADFGAGAGSRTTSIHSPIYVQGGQTAPQKIQESLAELMH